jgi:hypothetical protein
MALISSNDWKGGGRASSIDFHREQGGAREVVRQLGGSLSSRYRAVNVTIHRLGRFRGRLRGTRIPYRAGAIYGLKWRGSLPQGRPSVSYEPFFANTNAQNAQCSSRFVVHNIFLNIITFQISLKFLLALVPCPLFLLIEGKCHYSDV